MRHKGSQGKIILASLVVCCAVWLYCQRQEKTPPSAVPRSETPDQEGWNSTLVVSNLGKISARIQYGHMAKFSERQTVEFNQGVQLDLYNEQGQHSSRTTADRGILNERNNFVEAISHVVAHSDSGDVTLYTERLRWDDRRKKITSDEFVTFVTEKDTLYGYGFESNADLAHWVIKKPTGFSQRPFDVDWKRHFAKPAPEVDSSAVPKQSAPADTLTH